jgi:hypothetical protein
MFKRHVSIAFVAIFASFGFLTPTHAQDQGDLFVTARYWYALSGDHRFNSTGSSIDSSEMVPVGLGGASITYVPKNMGGTSFSFTGFYGTGDGDHREAGPLAGTFNGTIHYQRLDLEGLVQNPIAGTGATWGYGLRYVDLKVGANGFDSGAPPSPFQFQENIKLYLAELGFGLSAPVEPSGKFRLFANFNGVAGFRDQKHSDAYMGVTNNSSKSGGVVGVDTNAGIAWQFNPAMTFSARYRLFVLSDVDFNFQRETDIIHGPEANLTVKLN